MEEAKNDATPLKKYIYYQYTIIYFHTLRCRNERYPVLLSASVSDNSGNSPQMAAPRRSREIE